MHLQALHLGASKHRHDVERKSPQLAACICGSSCWHLYVSYLVGQGSSSMDLLCNALAGLILPFLILLLLHRIRSQRCRFPSFLALPLHAYVYWPDVTGVVSHIHRILHFNM
jgi:hypothetical protein